MFKSVLKSLILSVLCIFTISCSFVSENTGSLHLKLPNSNESRAYRSIDSGVNKELSYSIVITPDKTNYNQFSFSEDNVTDKLFVECIPIGKYTITINGSDGKYKYFNEPEVFYIEAGKKTSLNIKLQCQLIEEVKPTPEPEKPNVSKGNLLIDFKNGPVNPIELTVSLYQGTEKMGSDYTVKSNETLPINDLLVGADYKVVVVGHDNKNNYEATVDNISVTAETLSKIEVTLISTPITAPTPSDFTPNPSKKIYCVDPTQGDDLNNDGSKYFKTIVGAINKVKNDGVEFTIKVKGPITETAATSVQAKFRIENVDTVPCEVMLDITSSASEQAAWLTTSMDTVINGLKITSKKTNKPDYAFKVSGASLTLGDTVTINYNGSTNNAIEVGSSTTLNLSNPANINANNNIRVLNGGKIHTLLGFFSKEGTIKIDMSGVGGAENGQLVIADDKPMNINDKFSITSGNYDIDKDGKLINKTVVPSSSNTITSASDLQDKIDAAADGSVLTLKMGPSTTFIGLDKPISITKNITIKAADPVNAPIKLQKNSNSEMSLINIQVANRTKPTGTAEVIIEGFHLDAKNNLKKAAVNKHAAISATDTNVTLKNCVVENNSDTGILLVGDITAEINNTIVRNNTSIDNGGGIYLDSVNGYPELTLSGTTKISANKAQTSKLGGGIYVKEGNLTLLDSASITADNTAGTGPVLAFQNKNNCQLNGKNITNQHYSTLVDINTNK